MQPRSSSGDRPRSASSAPLALLTLPQPSGAKQATIHGAVPAGGVPSALAAIMGVNRRLQPAQQGDGATAGTARKNLHISPSFVAAAAAGQGPGRQAFAAATTATTTSKTADLFRDKSRYTHVLVSQGVIVEVMRSPSDSVPRITGCSDPAIKETVVGRFLVGAGAGSTPNIAFYKFPETFVQKELKKLSSSGSEYTIVVSDQPPPQRAGSMSPVNRGHSLSSTTGNNNIPDTSSSKAQIIQKNTDSSTTQEKVAFFASAPTSSESGLTFFDVGRDKGNNNISFMETHHQQPSTIHVPPLNSGHQQHIEQSHFLPVQGLTETGQNGKKQPLTSSQPPRDIVEPHPIQTEQSSMGAMKTIGDSVYEAPQETAATTSTTTISTGSQKGSEAQGGGDGSIHSQQQPMFTTPTARPVVAQGQKLAPTRSVMSVPNDGDPETALHNMKQSVERLRMQRNAVERVKRESEQKSIRIAELQNQVQDLLRQIDKFHPLESEYIRIKNALAVEEEKAEHADRARISAEASLEACRQEQAKAENAHRAALAEERRKVDEIKREVQIHLSELELRCRTAEERAQNAQAELTQLRETEARSRSLQFALDAARERLSHLESSISSLNDEKAFLRNQLAEAETRKQEFNQTFDDQLKLARARAREEATRAQERAEAAQRALARAEEAEKNLAAVKDEVMRATLLAEQRNGMVARATREKESLQIQLTEQAAKMEAMHQRLLDALSKSHQLEEELETEKKSAREWARARLDLLNQFCEEEELLEGALRGLSSTGAEEENASLTPMYFSPSLAASTSSASGNKGGLHGAI